MHNQKAMRVLVADRNGWLLESISRTFVRQFPIEVATTHEQCNKLLGQGEFDLVVISEKLADGAGLHLLAQIARSSPDTLRVFAARRSRLQLLKGKLGPFGLFRTLSYPIDPRELLSVLTLSSAGLDTTELPVMEAPAGAAVRKGSGVAPPREKAAAAAPAESPAAVPVVPAPKPRPSAERISFLKAAALISTNVPEMMGVKAGGRARSGTARVASGIQQPALDEARRVPSETSGPTSAEAQRVPRETSRPTPPDAPRQTPDLRQAGSHRRDIVPQVVQSRAPAAAQPLSQPPAASKRPEMPQRAQIAQRAQISQRAQVLPPAQMLPRPPEMPVSDLPHMLADPFAPVQLPSFSAQRSPRRFKFALGATIVVVFLATTVAINLLGGGVHESHAAVPAVAEVETPSAPVLPPVAMPTAFAPTPKAVQRSQPRPQAPQPEVEPEDPQVAASATPVADPSTFGSEAYEPIYSN